MVIEVKKVGNSEDCIVCSTQLRKLNSTYVCPNCGFNTEYSDL